MSKIGVTLKLNNLQTILKSRGVEDAGRVQNFIDSEVMRVMEPYMPFDTGIMAHSMPLATTVGSGVVNVNTPYSRRRLLSARHNGLRGPNYFVRMKADRLEEILDGACRYAGAKKG